MWTVCFSTSALAACVVATIDFLSSNGQSTEDGAADLYHALFTDASSLLPYVVLFNPDEAPGLAHSTIYDLPTVGSDSDSIAIVNSTIFTVTCGNLDSLKLEDYYPKDAREVWHYNISHVLPDGTKQKHIRVKNILREFLCLPCIRLCLFADILLRAGRRQLDRLVRVS